MGVGSLRRGRKRRRVTSYLGLLLALVLGQAPLCGADLLKSNFEISTPTYNPWAGVTDTGLIKVLAGQQLAVNDQGNIGYESFGPSVAVGDLNGDGLPDLVIADSHGFFWYFPNSGTATEPKFTRGEITPIWLGFSYGDPNYLDEQGADNIVPKIQLINLEGDGKLLDLVAGNYVGRLFYIHNTGTADTPAFRMPLDRSLLIVPTRRRGVLTFNYLSPFLYDWYGAGNLDLIMGDGGYSANSIYLFKNQDTRDHPVFNEDKMVKIIPGLGREHLTPQVIDWNNDGKPDIITGERTGHIDLFLNQSSDPNHPAFDQGQNLKLGGSDTFGGLSTVTVADLTAKKLPSLIITNTDGDIRYAQNMGKLGSPEFGDPVPLRGTNPFPGILTPIGWQLVSPHGVPNELLVCTNATVQAGFIPPPGTIFKNALRFYVYPIKNTYFNDFYYPRDEDPEPHKIVSTAGFQVKEKTDYKVSFWVRTSGNIRDLHYFIRGWAQSPDNWGQREWVSMDKDIDSSSSWSLFEDTTSFRLNTVKLKDGLVGVGFDVEFHGQGEVYLDDVRIRPAESDQP